MVAPAPVLGVPFPEIKQAEPEGDETFDRDAVAWALDEAAFQRLLGWMAARRSRVVVLSGDVDDFGARLEYQARQPYGQRARAMADTTVIAQLTSSALHKRALRGDGPRLGYRGPPGHVGPHAPRRLQPVLAEARVFDIAPPHDVRGWNATPPGDEVEVGRTRMSHS